MSDDIIHHRVEVSFCAGCGGRLDGATATDGRSAPEPGAISICAYCRTVHVFQEDLRLQPMGHAEFLSLPDDVRQHLLRAGAALAASSPAYPWKPNAPGGRS